MKIGLKYFHIGLEDEKVGMNIHHKAMSLLQWGNQQQKSI
jgi:hypothetical protein